MSCQFHASNAKRQRFSRWLLVLVLCWQSLMMFMPVAQAKAAAGEGGWETICTMNGSAQVWVAAESSDEESHAATASEHCPLCLMSSNGLAPPPVHNPVLEPGVGAEETQFVFNASYLTRAWSEQARGPPVTV
jgi:hypothetical protein